MSTRKINRIVAAEQGRTLASKRQYWLTEHAAKRLKQRFEVKGNVREVLEAVLATSRKATEHDPVWFSTNNDKGECEIWVNDIAKVAFVLAKCRKRKNRWKVVTMFPCFR